MAAERAYEERQEMIERVTRELDALREAGTFVGKVPFGFTTAGALVSCRPVSGPTAGELAPACARITADGGPVVVVYVLGTDKDPNTGSASGPPSPPPDAW